MYILSSIFRYGLCLMPYLILFSNKDIIYHITGPITIPPFNERTGSPIYLIAFMEFIRIFYPYIAKLVLFFIPAITISNKTKEFFLHKISVKYLVIILMKFVWISLSQSHRMKYYLHVFFL
jgi:hypothetical protein